MEFNANQKSKRFHLTQLWRKGENKSEYADWTFSATIIKASHDKGVNSSYNSFTILFFGFD